MLLLSFSVWSSWSCLPSARCLRAGSIGSVVSCQLLSTREPNLSGVRTLAIRYYLSTRKQYNPKAIREARLVRRAYQLGGPINRKEHRVLSDHIYYFYRCSVELFIHGSIHMGSSCGACAVLYCAILRSTMLLFLYYRYAQRCAEHHT